MEKDNHNLGFCLSVFTGIVINTISIAGSCFAINWLADNYYRVTKRNSREFLGLLPCVLLAPFLSGFTFSYYFMHKAGLMEIKPVI